MQLPAWIEEEAEHLRGLLIDLHQVRHKGVRGLRTNSAHIPQLVELAAARCPKASPQNQSELMTALLKEVLPRHLKQNQDQQSVQLYFGLSVETQASSEKTRREKTGLQIFHQSFSAFRDPVTGHERPFLVRLAEALDEARKALPRAKTYRNYSTSFIDRPKYRDDFEALITKGHTLIAFDGGPGNGKTRLADELVAMRLGGGDTRVDLEAGSATALMTQISGVLSRYADRKLKTYPLDARALLHAFAAFICSADAPTYLVIDNVSDAQLLDQLAPSSARSLTVITTQENILPPGRGESLTVKSMEDEEARQFAALLLPNNDTPCEIEWLIKTLGNKPLAIDHACTGLLADGDMTFQEFHTAFDRHAAVVMKQAKSPVDESLPFTYEQILSRLRRNDAKDGTKAATLLELIAFMAPEAIPEEPLRNALATASPPEDTSLAPVEFQSAQRKLQRLHLIQLRDDGFTIHQFTQAVLRDILHDKALERCVLLHRVLAGEFADLKPGDALGEDVIRLLPHTSKVLLGLTAIDPAPRNDEGIVRTISILAQGMRQVGNVAELRGFAQSYFSAHSTAEERSLSTPTINEDTSRVFLDDAYHDGLVPRSHYIGYVFDMLEQQYDNVDDIDLSSYAGTKLLETTMLSYRYDLVEALQKRHLTKPPKKGKQDAAWRGDVLRLVANAQAAQAKWEESLTTYRRALQVYELDYQNLNCLRGKLATLVSIANTAVEVGRLSLAMERLHAASTLMMKNMSNYRNNLILAMKERVTARTMTVESILSVVLPEQKLPRDRTYPDAMFDIAFKHHETAALGRHMLDVKYDWGCYRLLHGEVAEVWQTFREQAATARRLDELDTAFMYHLGLIKIRILEGGVCLRDIGRCLRISRKFLEDCHMPNRHADAVGTAYVVAVICNAPEQVADSLRESARSAHEKIDKIWKFDLLDRVASEELNPLALFLP